MKKGTARSVIFIVLMLAMSATPHDEDRHGFADQRTLFFGIPNTLNVVSTIPFFFVGLAGLILNHYKSYSTLCSQGGLCTLYFAGILSVGFGSSFYHINPKNATLFWDTFPMMLAFTSLEAIFIVERYDDWAGTTSLASTSYWLWAAGFYVLARLEEVVDKPIYSWTLQIVSGHTLAHLCAVMVPLFLILTLAKRTRPIEQERHWIPIHHQLKLTFMVCLLVPIMIRLWLPKIQVSASVYEISILMWEALPFEMLYTLLQSLAGSTFESNMLVLTARREYQSVNETGLEDLRNKHRPSVLSSVEERAKGLGVCKDSGLASKLYNFKREPEPLVSINKSADQMSDVADGNVNQENDSADMDDMYAGLTVNSEIDLLPDSKDQITWLKFELCRLLKEKISAALRADELETSLMEMVKQDKRRQLSAKAEQFEHELSELKQTLSDKQEQEQEQKQAMFQLQVDTINISEPFSGAPAEPATRFSVLLIAVDTSPFCLTAAWGILTFLEFCC